MKKYLLYILLSFVIVSCNRNKEYFITEIQILNKEDKTLKEKIYPFDTKINVYEDYIYLYQDGKEHKLSIVERTEDITYASYKGVDKNNDLYIFLVDHSKKIIQFNIRANNDNYKHSRTVAILKYR